MNVLFVDDSEPLVTTIEEWARLHGHKSANFYRSLKDARRAVERRDFSRIVADYKFDGEEEDGIGFLENIRDRRPEVELVLLTGNQLSSQQLARLRAIEAVLVHKSSLDSQQLEALLSKVRIKQEDPQGERSVVELLRDLHLLTSLTHNRKTFSCFVSHSSGDEFFARKLYGDLQRIGVDCWFAPEDMRPGDRIRDTITNYIYGKEKLILILSENSIASHWVETEVEAAFAKEREANTTMLIPIRVDASIFSARKAWATEILRTRHIQDFSNWRDMEAYNHGLVRLFKAISPEGPPNSSAPNPAPSADG